MKNSRIVSRWLINLDPNQAPPQQVAEKVLKLLEVFGEGDVEFAPPANKAFTSGTVEFNLPGNCLIKRTDHGEIKLSAASIFNSLGVKGNLVKLGLINTQAKTENNNDDNATTDSSVRGEEGETSKTDGGANDEVQTLSEAGGGIHSDPGETV